MIIFELICNNGKLRRLILPEVHKAERVGVLELVSVSRINSGFLLEKGEFEHLGQVSTVNSYKSFEYPF